MLKKINRLQKRGDFELLRQKGKFEGGPLFGISWLKNDDEEVNRFGFIISKKISKRAVDRNKIKRWLSEAVKKNLEEVKDKGLKVVFLVKKTVMGKKVEEVETEAVKMLQKIK